MYSKTFAYEVSWYFKSLVSLYLCYDSLLFLNFEWFYQKLIPSKKCYCDISVTYLLFCLDFHGQCSATCGQGTIQRLVSCLHGNQKVDSIQCGLSLMPETARSCEVTECPFWQQGEWGSVRRWSLENVLIWQIWLHRKSWPTIRLFRLYHLTQIIQHHHVW